MESVPESVGKVRGFLQEEYDRAFRHEHWHVGIVDAPIHAFLEPGLRPDVRWLPPPERGKYFADPFGVTWGETNYVFFEEFDFRSFKGVISWVRERDGGGFTEPQVAIDLPFHASYPFLVEERGELYCIPETGQGREVSIYRAIEFPTHWKKAATLLLGVGVTDSTVFRHGGRWWLLCTDLDDGPFSKLRIWHASDLLGPWAPHPGNPVKTDFGSSRPAGTPFMFRGELYRPAQDCSRTYGGSVVLNRVVRLTTTEYAEEQAGEVRPFWQGPYSHGLHTLSAFGDRTLVDGKRVSFHRQQMVRNLRESIVGRWPRVLLSR